MDEAAKRRWDVQLGLIAPVLTIAGVLVGVWQFLEGQERTVRLENELLSRQSAIEFRRQLWLEQLETYRRVSGIAGRIAAEHDRSEVLDELTREFLALYWGAMIFVEDEAVELAMIDFYQEVRDYRNGWSNSDRLKRQASALVEACRASTEAGWRRIDGGNGT